MKGQVQHAFSFLMFALLAVVTILLGYQLLTNLLGKKCLADQLTFNEELERALTEHSSYGSVQRVTLRAPCDAETLCFLDASLFTKLPDGRYEGTPSFTSGHGVIQAEARHPSAPPVNVFLLSEEGTTPLQLFAERVRLENPGEPLCIPARNGRFRLLLKGEGRRVLVSEVS